MRALIMAAGLGTRLRPLTDSLPKPLVPVLGRPMVEYVLAALAGGGVREAVINIHYLPEKMRAFVNAWNQRGGLPRLHVQDESAEILGSGGAVALAAPWLFERGGAALVCNSDVLAEPDLPALGAEHIRLAARGAVCTLAATAHPEAGAKYTGLRIEKGFITAFEKTGRADPALKQFPGYYLLDKAAADRLPPAGTSFSIVDALWQPLAAEGKLGAWIYDGYYFDLGTPEDLRRAEAELPKARSR